MNLRELHEQQLRRDRLGQLVMWCAVAVLVVGLATGVGR